MGAKFIHDSLLDFYTGQRLKSTVEENPHWQDSFNPLVQVKDTYSRWRPAFGQLSELASGEQVDELICWGESWQDGENLFGLDWLPRLYLIREQYDELSKVLTDLDFIEKKCMAGMTYDLVEDYNRLGVGRGKPGPPIRTAWRNYEGKLGVWCPFCLAWSEIGEDQIGKLIECPTCKMKLRINSFVINAEWQSCKAKRIISKQRTITANLPESVSDFADFVRSEAHILENYPQCTFQQAANQPDDTAPVQGALKRWHTGQEKRPWLHLLPKSLSPSPCLTTFTGHSDKILACAFSPDGSHIVSASSDKSLKIWDAATGTELTTLRGHIYPISACNFSHDGSRIVSGGGPTLKIWDAVIGTQLGEFKLEVSSYTRISCKACTFSADGLYAIGAWSNGKVNAWNIYTGAKLFELNAGLDKITACDMSPDRTQLISASGQTLWLLNTQTGRKKVLVGTIEKHEGLVHACAFSPDGLCVLSVSFTGLKLWDVNSGLELKTLNETLSVPFYSYVCAFSPNGEHIAASQGLDSLTLWQHRKCTKVGVFSGSGEIYHCAFSPDGVRLVSASKDKKLRLWDIRLVCEQYQNSGHLGSSRRNYVPINRAEHCFKKFGSASVRKKVKSHWNRSLEVAKWGELLKDYNIFKNAHSFIESTSAQIGTFGAATGRTVSPDGSREVRAWGYRKLNVLDLKTNKLVATLMGHSNSVHICAFSPDGSLVLSAAWEKDKAKKCGGEMKLWDIRKGEELSTLGNEHYLGWDFCHFQFAFSPNGSRIASAAIRSTGTGTKTKAGTEIKKYWHEIRLWDARIGKLITTLVEGPKSKSMISAFSPDGSCILAPSFEGTLKIFNALNGQELFTLNAESAPMYPFSRDGSCIVGYSSEGTKLFDVATGKQLAYPIVGFRPFVWSPCGRMLVLGQSVKVIIPVGMTYHPPLTTATLLWLFGANDDPGHPDDKLTAKCVWCGKRFEVKEEMLGKEVNCSHCSKPLKLNPFKAEPPPL